MAYEVLARKWRPQQFEDVVGQEHVTRTLTNAIESGRVAHAYIFVGSRGIGKTTSARILAKALNCEKGPTPHPCDTCDSCKEVMAGNSLDVIEIDGASNNGVDQVRDLRDNARYAPARGPFKIYIIDEVHMLSTAAFNALLKTLEEPPAHVKFIFANTDVHMLNPTILSRCQRFDLRRISVQDIMERLRAGCKEEGVTISDDALLAIARGAEGGLRDAESALDQIISFKGKKIEEEDVLSVFGLVSRHVLNELSQSILRSDVPGIIRIVAEMDQAGKDLQRVVMELLEHFRNLLVVHYEGGTQAVLELPEAQLDFYKQQATESEAGRILRVMDILIETDSRMRYAISRRTLLETGLIRSSRAAETATVNELLKQVATLKKKAEASGVEPVAQEAAPAQTEQADPQKKKAPLNELKQLVKQWSTIIERCAKSDASMRRCLLNTVPLNVEETHLTVGIDPEFANELEQLDHPKIKLTLARAVERELGRMLSISFNPLGAEQRKPLPSGKKKKASSASKNHSPNSEQRWYANPVVQQVVEAFNGEIKEIRE